MDNPYGKIKVSASCIGFSKRTAIVLILLFAICVITIPIYRHIAELSKEPNERWLPIIEIWQPSGQRTLNHFYTKQSKNPSLTRETPNLRDHLQAFESAVKDSPFRKRTQKSEQYYLSKAFKKGNDKVIQGKDGWLYFRPAIEALTGRGPLNPETETVTKDPDRPEWNQPLQTISTFHQQLKQRDIELMLVPIPVKPMLEQKGFGLSNQLIKHSDQDAFYQQLRDKGIEVIDLLPLFSIMQKRGQTLYLKQDTHWSANTSKATAEYISGIVKKKSWYQNIHKFPNVNFQTVERSAIGDLVEMLNLPQDNQSFTKETIAIERVLDPATGLALENNLDSLITLLGDSFVNIYEEPGLGFGDPKNDHGLIGAGFGSHLSAYLRLRPHIMAINGEGATGVRKAFATLPDNIVRTRKLVIWTIAYRDLFLSESAANRAGVYWQDVEFNAESNLIASPNPTLEKEESIAPPSDGSLWITAEFSEKSMITEDPHKTPYSEAVFTAIFKNIEVIAGEFYDDEILVYQLAFQDRKWTKAWSFKTGRRYQLKLMPITKRPAISRKKIFTDFPETSLEHFFVEEIQPFK